MLTVNTHEAKSQLSRLLARVSHGEEIVIAKSEKAKTPVIPIWMHPQASEHQLYGCVARRA